MSVINNFFAFVKKKLGTFLGYESELDYYRRICLNLGIELCGFPGSTDSIETALIQTLDLTLPFGVDYSISKINKNEWNIKILDKVKNRVF